MLVLTRKIDEKIMIGSDVVVTITKIQGNRVWIGLDAPASIKILRDEVLQKAKETQLCSSN